MQTQQSKKGIKIPTNLVHKIEQYQSSNQLLYFTLFINDSQSYIVDISTEKLDSLLFPICIQNENNNGININFKLIQQKITKQTKQQVLKKYTICQCDQINQIIQKYMIVNLKIQGQLGINTEIVGFRVDIGNWSKQIPNKDNSRRKIVSSDNFEQILQSIRKQCTEIWNIYNSRYCRSLADKTTKQQKVGLTHSLSTFLQFQVNVLTVPKIQQSGQKQKINRTIYEYDAYILQYPMIFLIKQQNIEAKSNTNQKSKLSNKIKQFVAQKLLQISKETDLTRIQKIISQQNKFISILYPKYSPKKIFNPHIFAKCNTKQKYQLILVKGVYQYYHYGDQSFNDNGWGCAYRALQTLISWLNIQGHTTQSISQMLSIKNIQQKLDQFDRSRKLKGSNTWIGATEISWLVPTLTTPSVNCKILHISDGKNILQKCQEFKHHFLTSGCPIMYGGGQYAYSIVGMYYNWKLAQCQFLILDPHYTGQDDYGKILEKKGLAWRKPQQMFKKGVFYNFCMPIIK